MNRSMLNAGPLGAGGASPYVSASASQAHTLGGTCAARVLKYARASQAHALAGNLRMRIRVTASASQAHTLVGACAARALRRVHASATSFQRLESSVVGRAHRQARAARSHTLSGTCVPRVLAAQHASANQSHSLIGACTAFQATTRAAPGGRTAGEVDLTPRQSGTVTMGED